MAKYKVYVEGQDPVAVNPFKYGSSKYALFQWAIDQQVFTKAEFLAAAEELRSEGKVHSVMPEGTMGRAWWNEFYSKSKNIRPAPDAE